MDLTWTCRCCGQQFDTLSFAYSLDVPDRWTLVPPAEQKQRIKSAPDRCVIDGTEFYLRGRIVIPVIGSATPFVWGVWAAISPQDFERIEELWNVEMRDGEPPFSGTLANDIPIYPPTYDLKCRIHLQNGGRRPSFELETTGHPLAAEQRNGITLDRVKEFAALILKHR